MAYNYIREYIKDILNKNREEKRIVNKYIVSTFIKSYIVFGNKHSITIECKNIYKLFKNIMKKENTIYKLLLNNCFIIDNLEFINLVDRLDILNDKTINYIYSMLDDIEDACSTNQETRANHYKKDFNYIVDNDDYLNEALGLIIGDKEIKDFLNYDEDFWKYIKTRIRRVDSRDDNKNRFYETVMHFDKDNKLDDMRVYVPYVINLKTSLVNIHEIKHAYDLYNKLGNYITEDVELFEEAAREKEKEFIKKYLPNINK